MNVCKLFDIVSSVLCAEFDVVPMKRISQSFSIKMFVSIQRLSVRRACFEELGFITVWRI